jgi:RNA polymerase subunit RPABC4/transcription elongation factor Spt4
MSQDTLNSIVLASVTIFGAVFTAFSVAFVIWTYNDMKARSRDPLAQIAAAILVAFLNIFGLIIYIMLRPRETLADAYERSLEEEALLQEIEDKPACPGCGRPTKHEWQVCPFCHTKLKKACIACHQMLELSWNLCPHCATPQVGAGDAEAITAGSGGKRRTSTPAPQRTQSPYDVGEYEARPPSRSQSKVQNDSLEWVDDSNY